MKDTLKTDAPSPDLRSLPPTEDLGQPLQGRPLNEEMLTMEGNSNIPPDSVDDVDTDGSDSGKTKRDDLWRTLCVVLNFCDHHVL